MRSWAAIAIPLCFGACAHRIEVEVPAAPAVAVTDTSMAVVAMDRGCRDLADRLVTSLNTVDGLEVRPDAALRLQILSCEDTVLPTVTRQQALGTRGVVLDRRRVDVDGRAQAVVRVVTADGIEAHVLATSRVNSRGEWSSGIEVLPVRRAVERELEEALVLDIVDQVRPVPRNVERRVFPNASHGSARALYSRAVRAEQEGRLDDARVLAEAAARARPNALRIAYARELAQRTSPGHESP